MDVLVVIVGLFIVGVFFAAALGNHWNRQKRPRHGSTRVQATRKLARDLQRLAAECMDGSVTIEEPVRGPVRMPQVEWTETFDETLVYRMVYRNNAGNETERYVRLKRRGTGRNHVRYIEAYDGTRHKTYREDRIVRIEEVPRLVSLPRTKP